MGISKVLKDLLDRLFVNEEKGIQKEKEILDNMEITIIERRAEINQKINLEKLSKFIDKFSDEFELSMEVNELTKELVVKEGWDISGVRIDLTKVSKIDFRIEGNIYEDMEFFIEIDKQYHVGDFINSLRNKPNIVISNNSINFNCNKKRYVK